MAEIVVGTREVFYRDRKGRQVGGLHALDPKSIVKSLYTIKELTPDQTTKNNVQTLINLILESRATF